MKFTLLVFHFSYELGRLISSSNMSLSFILLIQVLHAFATEGAHCSSVREILDASDVSFSSLDPFPFILSWGWGRGMDALLDKCKQNLMENVCFSSIRAVFNVEKKAS